MDERRTASVAASAFRDGVTWIVLVERFDDRGAKIDTDIWIDGIVADTEEQAIDCVLAQIKAQAN